jgi:hypothetical protein
MNELKLSTAIVAKLAGKKEKFDSTNTPSADLALGAGTLAMLGVGLGLVAVIGALIFFMIRVLIVRFLWNHCAVPAIGFQPVDSFWVMFGLCILLQKVL